MAEPVSNSVLYWREKFSLKYIWINKDKNDKGKCTISNKN